MTLVPPITIAEERAARRLRAWRQSCRIAADIFDAVGAEFLRALGPDGREGIVRDGLEVVARALVDEILRARGEA
jgi:hypothetical protein